MKISIIDAVGLSIRSDRSWARYGTAYLIKWWRAFGPSYESPSFAFHVRGVPNKPAFLNVEFCPTSAVRHACRLAPACHRKYLCTWQTVDCRLKTKRQARTFVNIFISVLSPSLFSLPEKKNAITQFVYSSSLRMPVRFTQELDQSNTFYTFANWIDARHVCKT